MAVNPLIGQSRLWPDDPLNRGLVGEWRFDRNTGLLLPDATGLATGAITDANWEAGRYGPALNFDAQGELVDIPVHSGIDFSGGGPICIEAFVYAVCARGGWHQESILRTAYAAWQNTNIYLFGFRVEGNVFPRFDYDENGNGHRYQADNALSVPGFYHLMFSYVYGTGASATWFVNGQSVAGSWTVGTGNAAATGPAEDLQINWDSASFWYEGNLLLLRVYKREFTENEARARYQICTARTSGLADFWAIPFLPTEAEEGIEVTPPEASAATTLVAPDVSLGSLNVAPTSVNAVAVLVAPTVTLGTVSITPAFAVVEVVSIAPTITLGQLAIPPPEATVVVALVAPDIVLGATTAEPTEAIVEAALIAPGITLGTLSITPSEATVNAALVAPSVVLASIVVTPSNAPIEAVSIAPTVMVGGVQVSPSGAVAETGLVAPSITFGSTTASPAPTAANTAAVAPSVGLGAMTVAPDNAAIVAESVAPEVVLGGITPPVVTAQAAAVAPGITLGSVTVSPASTTVIAALVAPGVLVGGIITVPLYTAALRTWTYLSRKRLLTFATPYRQYVFTAREKEMTTRYQIVGRILIQPSVSDIGPFTFKLGPQLPSGDDIASIEVKSYLDNTETTSHLISGTPTVSSNIVSVYFNYPGSERHGEHKITFIYTLISGAVDEADFFKVRVADY